jgi:hypothetical protein
MRSGLSLLVLPFLLAALGVACQSLEFGEGTDGDGGGRACDGCEGGAGDTTGTGSEPPADDPSDPSEAAVGRADTQPVLNAGEGNELPVVCGELEKFEHTSSKHQLAAHTGTASATWARALLRQGRRPEPGLLRLEEFRAFYLPAPKVDEGGVMLHVRELAAKGQGGDGGEGGAGGATGTKGDGGSEKPGDGAGGGGSGLPASYEGWDELELVARVDTPAARSERLRMAILVDVSPSMRDALPVTRGVIDAVASGLDRSGDELAVVTYAGDVRVERDLLAAEGLGGLAAQLDLSPRTGGALEAALGAAFGLGTVEEPVHVVLVTDGAAQATAQVEERVALARKSGARLSVVLVGKPDRSPNAAATPPSFRREFGDKLISAGGGRLHVLTDVADVADVLGGQGFARNFGAALGAQHLGVELGPYFHLALPDATGAGQGATFELAPGRSYSVRLPALVCSAEMLATQPGTLLAEVAVRLYGADPVTPIYETVPTSFEDLRLDAVDWVDLAVTATVSTLRGGSELAAADQIDEAQEALACASSPEASGCDALAELEGLLQLHGSASSNGG